MLATSTSLLLISISRNSDKNNFDSNIIPGPLDFSPLAIRVFSMAELTSISFRRVLTLSNLNPNKSRENHLFSSNLRVKGSRKLF